MSGSLIFGAVVMPTHKLGDIPVKVFVADFMEGALVGAPFQDAPKRFHAVDVDLLIDIFTNAVPDELMLVSCHVPITHEVIGVNCRAFLDMVIDELM